MFPLFFMHGYVWLRFFAVVYVKFGYEAL